MFSQGLKKIIMFACLNDIWNKMLKNDRNGLWTWVYIEDIDQLIYCKPTCRILSNMFFLAKAHNSNMFGICRKEHVDESAKKMMEVWFALYSLSARKIL